MDQFTNINQIAYYDIARPKYTSEIFQEIINKTNNFNSYLDIACGTGQLLIPLSQKFSVSIGLDVSEAQVNKTKENILKNNIQNVKVFTCDVYQIADKLKEENLDMKFDLITVGQAFHWFEEEIFLKYMKTLLKEGGVLVLAGYSKEHFDKTEQPDLYKILDKTIKRLLPYFECDIDNNDNAYYKSHESIKKIFPGEFVTKHYIETAEVPLNTLFGLLRSWSAYNNYKKSKKSTDADIIDDLEKELVEYFGISQVELQIKKVIYHNFYYTLTIKN
jgi:ubiquinone/menaquinone biosynthesis C-methylase UbiE